MVVKKLYQSRKVDTKNNFNQFLFSKVDTGHIFAKKYFKSRHTRHFSAVFIFRSRHELRMRLFPAFLDELGFLGKDTGVKGIFSF